MYKSLIWFSGIALTSVVMMVAFGQIVQFQAPTKAKTPAPTALGTITSATRPPALSPEDFTKRVDEKAKKTDQDLADRALKMLKPPLPPMQLPNMTTNANQPPPQPGQPSKTQMPKNEKTETPTNTFVPEEEISHTQPMPPPPARTTPPPVTSSAPPPSSTTNTPASSNAGGWSIRY